MKYLFTSQQILENISQAKAILRKNNIEQDDEKYLAILDKTKKDGYTGYITKLVFSQNVELEEALSLYDGLKDNKIDLGKISKMDYDDVLDLVYQENEEVDSDIQFLFDYKDYKVFHVKTYEGNLKMGSPAWCLKTKSHWDMYARRGEQFTAIHKDYIKKGVIKLSVPNTFFSSFYNNNRKPEVRLGLTVNNNNAMIFDDNNNKVSVELEENKKLIDKLRETIDLDKFGDKELVFGMENQAEEEPQVDNPIYRDNNMTWQEREVQYAANFGIEIDANDLSNILNEEEFLNNLDLEDGDDTDTVNAIFFYLDLKYGQYTHSFNHMVTIHSRTDFDQMELDIEELFDTEINNGITFRQYFTDYKEAIISNDRVTQSNGFFDILLYKLFGDEITLCGYRLEWVEPSDTYYTYIYGRHRLKWGKKMILQSFDSIEQFLSEMHIFLREYLEFYHTNIPVRYFSIEKIKDGEYVVTIDIRQYNKDIRKEAENSNVVYQQIAVEDIYNEVSILEDGDKEIKDGKVLVKIKE